MATADSAEVDERNAPGAAQDALVAAADIVERAKTVPPAAARTARPARAIAGPRRPSSAVGTETIDIDARVPYFASDLRRILLTAALMIAIIVVASYFIR